MPAYQLNVTNKKFEVEAEADMPLLWVLRDTLKIGWQTTRKKNQFLGIAVHPYIVCDAYAAHAVEVELLAPKKFRIRKVVTAIDCGIVIEPDGLKKPDGRRRGVCPKSGHEKPDNGKK